MDADIHDPGYHFCQNEIKALSASLQVTSSHVDKKANVWLYVMEKKRVDKEAPHVMPW